MANSKQLLNIWLALVACASFSLFTFNFSPAAAKEPSRHRLIVVADPQVYFESELDSVRRAADDIARTVSDGIPTVGVVLFAYLWGGFRVIG